MNLYMHFQFIRFFCLDIFNRVRENWAYVHNIDIAWYYSYTCLQYIWTNDQVCVYERPITDLVKHMEGDLRLWDYQEGL